MNPIRWVFARNLPLKIWLTAALAGAGWFVLSAVQPHRETFLDWRQLLVFLALAAATLVATFYAAMLGAFIVLSPFYQFQSHLNGAPFRVGDQVRILKGRESGRVTSVYSLWQGGTVRVEIGEGARIAFRDIYAPHEVQLVSRSADNRPPNSG